MGDLSKPSCTETQIKEAAKRLFFVEGNLNATTQEIADAAGVNRTLLNYYFRSRDELFSQVYLEGRKDIQDKLEELLSLELPFREKVANFVDKFSDLIYEVPYSQIFMVSEINSVRKNIPQYKRKETAMNQFMEEVEAEMEKGIICKMNPLNFIINLFALISYPVLMKPLYSEVFKLNDQSYEQIIQERKEMIMKLIFKQTIQ